MRPQETSPHSAWPKLGSILFLALIAVLTYLGVLFYRNIQNTPERVVQHFVQEIQKGEVDPAYQRLSTDLKNGREQYWKNYLDQFKKAEGEAVLVSQELVKDDFNTYPASSEPQRFVYKFSLPGGDYQLHIVIYKLKNVWVISGLTGGYK